jgi:hypothetical protein
MVCPGLQSMYARLSVEIAGNLTLPDGFRFQSIHINRSFREIDIAIAGEGLVGKVSAFARHAALLRGHTSHR